MIHTCNTCEAQNQTDKMRHAVQENQWQTAFNVENYKIHATNTCIAMQIDAHTHTDDVCQLRSTVGAEHTFVSLALTQRHLYITVDEVDLMQRTLFYSQQRQQCCRSSQRSVQSCLTAFSAISPNLPSCFSRRSFFSILFFLRLFPVH